MFLARVLLGQCTNFTATDRRPPMNEATGRLFDSTTGYLGNTKCYVIFDPMQHYPEYIIEFNAQ